MQACSSWATPACGSLVCSRIDSMVHLTAECRDNPVQALCLQTYFSRAVPSCSGNVGDAVPSVPPFLRPRRSLPSLRARPAISVILSAAKNLFPLALRFFVPLRMTDGGVRQLRIIANSRRKRPQAAKKLTAHATLPPQYPVMLCNVLPLTSVTPSNLPHEGRSPVRAFRSRGEIRWWVQGEARYPFAFFCRITKETARPA